MNKNAIAIILSVGAALSALTSEANAQQAAIPHEPPKVISVAQFSESFKRYLESMGYRNVKLTPGDKGISGSAMKGRKKVEILFNERGQLDIRDAANSYRSDSNTP